MAQTLVIGIAGGTGSGKTTVTRKLVQRFGSNVSVVHHDNFYKEHHDIPFEERKKLNYDHPDAFDTDMLVEKLKELKEGRPVQCPVYDFTVHDRSDRTVTINPAKVVIVEGILIFADPALCGLMDIKIFVDTDADERILRRIIRDVRDRGRSVENVASQYLSTVKPMHEMYVEPSKKNADIIVPNGGHNRVALNMIMCTVKDYLERN